MLEMNRLREILTTPVITSLIAILLCSNFVHTSPLTRRIFKRSYNLPHDLTCDSPVTMGDGMLRDMMMIASDRNRDNKLSEAEITWFYRNVVQYSAYVSQTFGRYFIDIADLDHDGLLNNEELLCMLGAMSASSWTKR